MRTRTITIAMVIVASGLLLLLAAAYLVLQHMDLSGYRPEITARVKAATGRELRIGGDLTLGLGTGLSIGAGDLALANAGWGSRPQMLTVGRAEANLALLPLLLGEIRVKEIRLHDLDLLLETDASGTGNWVFASQTTAGSAGGLELGAIVIESGKLTWRPAGAADAGAIELDRLRLRAEVDGDRRRINASGRLRGEAVEVTGTLPALAAWSGERPLNIDLRVTTPHSELRAEGTVQRRSGRLHPNLALSATPLDLHALGRLAGRSLPALPPIDARFALSRTDRSWKIDRLQLAAGESRLTGELQLSPGPDRPRLTGRIDSPGVDLADFMPSESAPEADPAASGDQPAATASPPLTGLRRLDGSLKLRLERLTSRGHDLNDVEIDAELDGGILVLQPIGADFDGGGRATGRLELDAGSETPDWRLDLEMTRFPAALLLGPGRGSLIEAPADLTLELRTRGASIQPMADRLAGRVRLRVDQGRARLKGIDTLVGGLSTVAGQLLEEGADDARLNCVIGDFDLRQGVAKARILLIDSAVSTVRGEGRIDLAAGRVDLTFVPRAKKPTLSVAVPVHVRGPLRGPKFTPDRESSLIKLLGVAGIFVYPPAALAALGELGSADNACVHMIQEGASSAGGSSSTVDRIGKGIEDAAEGIGRGLDELFGD